jgi:hypothetical protein
MAKNFSMQHSRGPFRLDACHGEAASDLTNIVIKRPAERVNNRLDWFLFSAFVDRPVSLRVYKTHATFTVFGNVNTSI